MAMTTQGREARKLIEGERNGVLSTLSKRLNGFPFGSITPYALSDEGDPLILISELAEHTKNLRNDARASLLVQDEAALADPQAGARATLMGYAMPVPEPLIEGAQARYVGRFPKSESYLQVHDFSLFKIKVEQVRFIGGFGEIHWINGEEMSEPTEAGGPLAPHARMICDHMNEDHADALVLYASAFKGLQPEAARMLHVDRYGFDMVTIKEGRHRHTRIEFAEPVETTEQVRAAMVEMVRKARQSTAR